MTQETVLAPALTAATSTAIVVEPGSTATIGIFSATREDKAVTPAFSILLQTPGADNLADYLSGSKRQVIVGPGTYRVQRRAYDGIPFGVFVER